MLSLFACAASGLVLNHPMSVQRANARMALVDDFIVSRVIKDVRVFDGDYSAEIQEAVIDVATACIEDKGSFSIAIPGGSVVTAFSEIKSEDIDFTKVHVFLCNEKIPSYPCIEGALEAAAKVGIPPENVYAFDKTGSPAEAAAKYTETLKSHPSVDNDGTIPSVDMMLLGTGPDGHCGCLFPESAEIKVTGAGDVVVAGNDERADGDFLALTMDVMCATKVVLISAAGSGRAPMVAKALSGEFGLYDCPAGMVEAQEETLWFTDKDGITEYEALDAVEDVEEDEEEDA